MGSQCCQRERCRQRNGSRQAPRPEACLGSAATRCGSLVSHASVPIPKASKPRQGHGCYDHGTTLCPRKLFIPSLAALYRFDASCRSDKFSVDSRFSAVLRYLHQIPAHHRADCRLERCLRTNRVRTDSVGSVAAASGVTVFCEAFGARRGSDRTPPRRAQAQKKGLQRSPGKVTPQAPMTTRNTPYGVYETTRDTPLGQPVCPL